MPAEAGTMKTFPLVQIINLQERILQSPDRSCAGFFDLFAILFALLLLSEQFNCHNDYASYYEYGGNDKYK